MQAPKAAEKVASKNSLITQFLGFFGTRLIKLLKNHCAGTTLHKNFIYMTRLLLEIKNRQRLILKARFLSEIDRIFEK